MKDTLNSQKPTDHFRENKKNGLKDQKIIIEQERKAEDTWTRVLSCQKKKRMKRWKNLS